MTLKLNGFVISFNPMKSISVYFSHMSRMHTTWIYYKSIGILSFHCKELTSVFHIGIRISNARNERLCRKNEQLWQKTEV